MCSVGKFRSIRVKCQILVSHSVISGLANPGRVNHLDPEWCYVKLCGSPDAERALLIKRKSQGDARNVCIFAVEKN